MFLKLAKELGQIKTGQEDYKVDYFSKKAAKDYIYEKIPLNDSIKKIAQENNLSDEFIKRICEQSNHAVSSHMFQSNQDKNFEFPLADSEVITNQQEKVASSVYENRPSFYKSAVIGPILNLATLGIPGLIGGSMGTKKGKELYDKGEFPGERSTLKSLLIPGYNDYRTNIHGGMLENYERDSPEYISNYNKLVDEGMKDKSPDEMDQELVNRGMKVPNFIPIFHPEKGLGWQKAPEKSIKGQEKTAIIGPLADLLGLGIPSLVRHSTGHKDGQKAFNEGKKLEGNEGGGIGKLLLVPGQLGYSMGFPRGHGEAYLDKNHDQFVANDPILDPYFNEHVSDKIKRDYQHNKAVYQPERKEHLLNQMLNRGAWEVPEEDEWDEANRHRQQNRKEKSQEKSASERLQIKMAELFPAELKLKSDPYQSVMDLKETLLRSQQIIDHEVFSNERRQSEIYPHLYNEFKNELEDSSYYKVAQAIIPFLKNQEVVEKLTYDLLDDSIITEEDFFRIEKLAEVINEDAKIIKMAQYYENLIEDYSILLEAQKEIKEQAQRVCDFLNKR